MSEWYETFFSGLYSEVLSTRSDDPRTLKDAQIIKNVLRLRRGMRVLDTACGMGRIAHILARMGMKVTGVDLVDSYVRRGRRSAKRDGLDIHFLRADMREIKFEREFDAVINWFTSFGYFSDEDNLAFLKKAHAALKPGGKLLIETINKSALLKKQAPKSEETLGKVHVEHMHVFDRATSRMHDTWTLIKGKRSERHRISVKVFNGTEMRAILRKAGFRDVTLHGRPPQRRFSRHSWRMIAVATRTK